MGGLLQPLDLERADGIRAERPEKEGHLGLPGPRFVLLQDWFQVLMQWVVSLMNKDLEVRLTGCRTTVYSIGLATINQRRQVRTKLVKKDQAKINCKTFS